MAGNIKESKFAVFSFSDIQMPHTMCPPNTTKIWHVSVSYKDKQWGASENYVM